MSRQGDRPPQSPSALLARSFAAGALFVVGGAVTLAALAALARQRRPELQLDQRPRFLPNTPSAN